MLQNEFQTSDSGPANTIPKYFLGSRGHEEHWLNPPCVSCQGGGLCPSETTELLCLPHAVSLLFSLNLGLQENARDTPVTSLQYIPELHNQILITVRLYIKAEICQVTIGFSILDSH